MTRSLAHVSVKPWGEITEADYDIEQWHRACLIHQHQDAPTSKAQCKLPVMTPNGSVNRNGVHAAAAALAGARGGVDATPEQKATAAKALLRLYSELGEDPPASLQHSDEELLIHYGVKGMKWGVRRDGGAGGIGGTANAARDRIKKEVKERTSTEVTVRAKPGRMVRVVGGTRRLPHEDTIAARSSEQIAKKNTLDALSNKELQHLVNRMNLEQQYRNLASKETRKTAGEKFAEYLVGKHGDKAFDQLGPLSSVGKNVVNQAIKGNKAMRGGIVDSGKKNK